MRTILFAAGILIFPTLLFGSALTSISGQATELVCPAVGLPASIPFAQTGNGHISSGLIDTTLCSVPGISGQAQVAAVANLLGSPDLDVKGAVDTLGFDSSGYFTAISSDTVTLNSPVINYTGGVSIVVGASYRLFIKGASLTSPAEADVSFTVPTINGGTNLSFPPGAHAIQTTNGDYTGQISDEFTILSCPCSFVYQARVDGSASNGSHSYADDPFFIQLPPGWTYTFSSQESVPEPSGLILVGFGLIALVVGLRCSAVKGEG